MPRFSNLGPGDRFRALVGAQVSQDPARLDTALKSAVKVVGEPQGLARQQVKNEYETFRMLAADPVKLQAYAHEVLDRAARSSGLTIAELKTSVADAMRAGLDQAEVVPPEAMRAAREVEGIDGELLAQALAELDALVGLEPLKAFVHKLVEDATWDALIGKNAEQIDNPFGDAKKKEDGALRHLRIAGNPGAGKTTAVEVLGKVYKALGKVSKGHVHKVDAKDLIGQYLGQTVARTAAAFKEARGGIFFIDDVQTILPSGQGGNADAYNEEALNTLLGFAMEHDVLIAIATYPDRMDDFVGYDPGFKSRFPTEVEFPDFSPNQLTEIFERLCHAHNIDYSEQTMDKVGKLFRGLKLSRNFGNARLVNNCFNDWVQNQRTRVLAGRDGDNPPQGVDIKTLRPEDITQPSGGDLVTIGGGGLRTREDVHKALDGCVVGHNAAKAALSDAVFERMHLRASGKGTQKPVGFHFFAGPSGVGKTEIAKGLASTCYGGKLEVIDCSKLTSLHAVEAMVHGRLSALDGKSSVVLLDEVEKAHPALFTHLLRVADEGKLMQAVGDADLSSCHFLMTSNLGNPEGMFDKVDPKSQMGEYANPKQVESDFANLFDKALPAEFKGRLSEDPIVFRPLGKGALDQILDSTLEKLVQVQARAYDRTVEVAPDLRKKLVELGHNPRLGARPMERVVRRQVLLPFLEAMVSHPDAHPAGHMLKFSLGQDEKPKLVSKADPALTAANLVKKKAEAAAEHALVRAFGLETLARLVEDGCDDLELLAQHLGKMHAALPKSVETMGIDTAFAELMKEVADNPIPGLTQAVAQTLVEAQSWDLRPDWPLGVLDSTRAFVKEAGGDMSNRDAADILEASVKACGRRLPPVRASAQAELARAIAGLNDDASEVRDQLDDAIRRASALDALSSMIAKSSPDGYLLSEDLGKFAAASPSDSFLHIIAATTHKILSRDNGSVGGYQAMEAVIGLLLKWTAAAKLPALKTQRAQFSAAMSDLLKQLPTAKAADHAEVHDLALRAMDQLLALTPDGEAGAAQREEALDKARRGSPAKRWQAMTEALGDALDLDPTLTQQLGACSDLAVANETWAGDHWDRDLAEATEVLQLFVDSRAKVDPQGKLLQRLLKLASAEGAENDGRAEVLLGLGLELASQFTVGHDAGPAEVGDAFRKIVGAGVDALEERMDYDSEATAPILQSLLDAVKATYAKDSAEGAWAKKAGAQLTRKSDDDKLEILKQAFVTE